MKTALGREQTGAARRRPRKLDGGLHSFAAATPEKHFVQPAASEITESARQFAGQFWHMALQHRWTASLHFLFQCSNYVGMVVPDVVDAVAGKVIENAAAVSGKKFASEAPFILHIHLKQIEKCGPPGINVIRVVRVC